MFLCFEPVAFSSGGCFVFRCSSFFKDTLCSYKSCFLFDQVHYLALASLSPCLLDIFTHNSAWHPKKNPVVSHYRVPRLLGERDHRGHELACPGGGTTPSCCNNPSATR